MGRGGYALAVLSRRCRGHVVPLDLLRVVASVANRAGVRRRVASAFKGYLVTDAGPGVVPMFSARREWHVYGFDSYCATSHRMPLGLVCGGSDVSILAGGPLDAPVLIAAGSFSVSHGCNGSFVGREQ